MKWLAIGIGNTLRRDDGVGPWLAERIAERNWPDVTVRVVHQLTPELAFGIGQFDFVLFLDASRISGSSKLHLVEPACESNRLGHAFQPGDLMALAKSLSPHMPQAWIAAIPGLDFDFGEGLSPSVQAEAERMLEAIDMQVGAI